MKVILEFNLPEEDVEHRQALDGHKWESVVWNLQRACHKHGILYNMEKATIADMLDVIAEEMVDKNIEFSP